MSNTGLTKRECIAATIAAGCIRADLNWDGWAGQMVKGADAMIKALDTTDPDAPAFPQPNGDTFALALLAALEGEKATK